MSSQSSAVSTPGFPDSQPLSAAAVGPLLRIVGVDGGQRLERRLHELGLPRGTTLRIVQRLGRNGATVVLAHGARLAVGADVARRIEVVPAGTE